MPNNIQIPTKCPNCQAPLRHIPSGISRKTGKPYQEFWACQNPDCQFTWRKSRPQNQTTQRLANIEASLKIMNDNIIHIANAIEKLIKKQNEIS